MIEKIKIRTDDCFTLQITKEIYLLIYLFIYLFFDYLSIFIDAISIYL